jgi:hypothetical protein
LRNCSFLEQEGQAVELEPQAEARGWELELLEPMELLESPEAVELLLSAPPLVLEQDGRQEALSGAEP